ncbi:MAG: cytochrome c [Vicinamibacteria bacterium]
MTRGLLPAALILAFTFAPSPSTAEEWPSPRTGVADVPDRERARANPLEGDPDAIRAGHKLFRRHCAGCHGEDGRGGKRGPALGSSVFQKATSGTLFWFLTNGDLRAGMPSWSRLPEAQRWQMAAFLKTWRTSETRLPAPQRSAPAANSLALNTRLDPRMYRELTRQHTRLPPP